MTLMMISLIRSRIGMAAGIPLAMPMAMASFPPISPRILEEEWLEALALEDSEAGSEED